MLLRLPLGHRRHRIRFVVELGVAGKDMDLAGFAGELAAGEREILEVSCVR